MSLNPLQALVRILSGGSSEATIGNNPVPVSGTVSVCGSDLSNIAAGAFIPLAPVGGACYVASVSAGSSHFNLTGTALATACAAGKTLLVTADTAGDVFYYWTSDATGRTASNTANGFGTGATQTALLAAGTQRYEKPAANTLGLVTIATAATYLRAIPVT